MTSPLPTFDVRSIPFSRRGSWLNLSPVVALHTVVENVHLVSHQTGMNAVLEFVPQIEGLPASAVVTATPAQLTWQLQDGSTVEAVFERTDALRLRGTAELRIRDAAAELTPFTGTYFYRDPIDSAPVFTSYETGRRYRITVLTGHLEAEGLEALGAHGQEARGAFERAVVLKGDGGAWEALVEEMESAARSPFPAFDFADARQAVEQEFSAFLDTIAPWRSDRTPAVPLAAYVVWSATVSPRGVLQREAVLMSKHWMDKVWSWDHCFNALALASGEPELALDQFLTPFDHQDAAGALPDSVTHSEVLYNYVKPPIHGWALARLRREHLQLDAATLEDLHGKLVAWTRFWLDYRRRLGRPLPSYQHGNDSGWDNSTTFDHDRVIESPDLAAFLLVQLHVLAGLAEELGHDATAWSTEAERIRAALLEDLWRDGGFEAVGVFSGRRSKRSSLLNLLPIVAAEHLPRECVHALVSGIRHHLTEWGPATQLVDSPEYQSDGYWRGPIWAPSTILIEDGLRRAGATELADEVSRRFRLLCETSGFAENFDALTGEGLRDRAYTWTASAYLTLAREAESVERA